MCAFPFSNASLHGFCTSWISRIAFTITTVPARTALAHSRFRIARIGFIEWVAPLAVSSLTRWGQYVSANALAVIVLASFAYTGLVRGVIAILTGSAATVPIPEPDRVGFVVRMPLWAVRLSSVLGLGTIPTTGVFAKCDDFQMVGTYTCAIPAEVIHHESYRNWAYQPEIAQTMDGDRHPLDLEYAVPFVSQSSSPFPTVIRSVALHLLPEPFPQVPIIKTVWQRHAKDPAQRGHLSGDIARRFHRFKINQESAIV